MTRTVLITGAGGFLAGHFAPAFAAAGWRVVGVGRSDPDRHDGRFDAFHLSDLAEAGRILPLLDRYAPDLVIHLAAPSSVAHSVRAPLADFDAHVVPTAMLLEAVRLSGGKPKLLLVSSAAVYGNPETLPVAESAPTAPISPYGFHKMHQELLMREARVLSGLPVCTLRLFSTYGENLRRLAVWDIARRALAGEPSVYGTGNESRDYLYAGDVAAAVVAVAGSARFDGEMLNVGSGVEVTIRELAARIFELLGVPFAPKFTGETLAGSPARWRADVTRLASHGWQPPDWSRGLAQTCAWIRSAP